MRRPPRGVLAGHDPIGDTQLDVTGGCGGSGPSVGRLAPLAITRVILRSAGSRSVRAPSRHAV